MSVILFAPADVYQELADGYERLKPQLRRVAPQLEDHQFYRALRRLSFANVAAYLYQYHDATPLPAEELASISPFGSLIGNPKVPELATPVLLVHQFLNAWSRLKYNLVTNDGEMYQAQQSVALMDELAAGLSELMIADIVAPKEAA